MPSTERKAANMADDDGNDDKEDPILRKLELLRGASSQKRRKAGGGGSFAELLSGLGDGGGGGGGGGRGAGLDLRGAIKAAKNTVVQVQNRSGEAGEDGSCAEVGDEGRGGRGKLATSSSAQGSKKQKKVHSLPMDWDLKKAVHFQSKFPFDCFTTGFHLAPELAHQAMRSFTSGNRRSRDANQMFLQSLYTWALPLNSLEIHGSSPMEDANNLVAEGVVGAAVEMKRLHDEQRARRFRCFREGLRDLVYALYAGLCSCFYVVPPPGSPDAFVCLFQAAGVQGCAGPSATVTSSTEGMLRLMREEFGLTPAEAREAAGPGPKRAKGKIAEKLKLDGSAGNKGRVHFVGREQVHGLFDFLATTCGSIYHKNQDAPTLLSPVPFVGAGVKRYTGVYRKKKLLKNKHEAGLETFTLSFECRGSGQYLPPWVVDRLCSTFRRTQHSFSMTSEQGVEVGGLSAAEEAAVGAATVEPAAESAGSRGDCYGGGFWDTEEGDKWEQPGGGLQRMTCEKGVFYL